MDGVAVAIVLAGVLAGAGTAVRAGLRAGIPVLLDFLLAAGLLRLSSAAAWDDIAVIAAIVAVRHLVTLGLKAGTWPRLTSTSVVGRCSPDDTHPPQCRASSRPPGA